MIIRPLGPTDAVAYQQLRLRALEENPTAFSSSPADESSRSMEDVAERITPLADGSKCNFGAFIDSQLVGLLTLIRPMRVKRMHCVDLAGMVVASELRRHGVGGALLDAVIVHARAMDGVRQMKLSVTASNVAARTLYQSRGFVCFGVEPDALFVGGSFHDEAFYMLRL
ncbi:GNAT family N-acetyltransferase [Rhodanobacter sp. L36]|uniref:GNAT family N-acetyltransferase n=1 Tax=Rhodanobacter sp. L36 TaxID=1747221 RepID=UPI00131B4FFD|nr:GNAT family N-acetyltransferase [Rhodanobacter sp. L36]